MDEVLSVVSPTVDLAVRTGETHRRTALPNDWVPAEPAVELTILMPCLNEARTLPVCIAKARSFLARAGVEGEVLVADNGSTDGSQDVARGHGARVIAVRERGYGTSRFVLPLCVLQDSCPQCRRLEVFQPWMAGPPKSVCR